MSVKPLEALPPTETLEIENGLSLVPRIKLILTVHPSLSTSATKPIDEWKLKRALIDFLKTSLSLTVPEEDLGIKRYKDLKKRKRDDPVAHGTLCIRDLGFLNKEKDEDSKVIEEKFLDWRKYIVEKMDGIELNLEGYKYKLSVTLPESDDFQGMKKAWEEFSVFGNRGGRQEPDTIVMRGVPSRWFAEPRVSSSKPSMLVTHTVFSTFGRIRNLNVTEDDDHGKDADEDDIISGLYCKIVVQFEKHGDFYNALKVLCGRSLQKQGTWLKADYEVTWTKDRLFRNSSSQVKEKNDRMPVVAGGHYRNEAPRRERYISQLTSDDTSRKRFKE
ncbi:A-kinase anchor protein 17A isoform X1 [Ricinus communis]|uniref:A-kinase anchor protein 17A isoform X1 n=1 Tax=Ricinus communis TaxID=3988 RepID=UPI000772BE7E|nr:A-kinase anchor protein 17A isoform X1 [Ricinus communis]|eukprot:XP_015576302.1 A-kinase anchor protein 17A [Ricinus communis]